MIVLLSAEEVDQDAELEARRHDSEDDRHAQVAAGLSMVFFRHGAMVGFESVPLQASAGIARRRVTRRRHSGRTGQSPIGSSSSCMLLSLQRKGADTVNL